MLIPLLDDASHTLILQESVSAKAASFGQRAGSLASQRAASLVAAEGRESSGIRENHTGFHHEGPKHSLLSLERRRPMQKIASWLCSLQALGVGRVTLQCIPLI